MNDSELLKQHRNGLTVAFPELVRRHLGWVYGVARRRLRDVHQAEDVAQAVFVLLHRKGPAFTADSAMISWLYTVAWRAADVAARNEMRRQRRETTAAILSAQDTSHNSSDDIPWENLAQMLDELIGRLSRADAEAVLLRYYRDMSFAEVAAELKTTPEAARKRVERAIEKLRRIASDKGIDVTSASLLANISGHLSLKTPAGLTATTTVAATAPVGSPLSLSGSAIAKGVFIMTASTKIAVGTAMALFLLLACGTIWHLAPTHASQNVASTPTTAPTTQDAPASEIIPRASAANGLLVELNGTDLIVEPRLGRARGGGRVAVGTDANTRFQVDGALGKLEDLSTGMSVIIVSRRGSPQTVLATSNGVKGTVIRVEGKNLIIRRLPLADPTQSETTIATDENTRINFVGAAMRGPDNSVTTTMRPGLHPIEDIQPGMSVNVSPETGIAKAIQVSLSPGRGGR